MGKISSSRFDTENASADWFPNPPIHKGTRIYFTQRTILGVSKVLSSPLKVVLTWSIILHASLHPKALSDPSSWQKAALVPKPSRHPAWCQGKFLHLLTSLRSSILHRAFCFILWMSVCPPEAAPRFLPMKHLSRHEVGREFLVSTWTELTALGGRRK